MKYLLHRLGKVCRWCAVFFFLIISTFPAQALIGDTSEEAAARYGEPLIADVKQVDGTEYAQYMTGDFVISHYYLRGVCVHARYIKLDEGGTKREFLLNELRVIIDMEARQGRWEVVVEPGASDPLDSVYASFENADGTLLEILESKKVVDLKSAFYFDHLAELAENTTDEPGREI